MSNSLLATLQQSLGRDYAIERELGGGGMARVFVAEERALGRKVVIKVLPPDAAGGVSVDRFKREVQLAARLQHPHIVPLLVAGEIDGILYYTMPFIEGESLRARVAREHELPVGDAVRILRDIADALAYAHAHDVVHRDIKPDNVLLTGQHAVVADFGIAKAIATARQTSAGTLPASITQLGVALGTPAYMAPEQASADPHVDHRADIYALGAVGYELLTGRPPFTGHSPHSLLAAVIAEAPDPIVRRRSSVPPAIERLIMQCLEKRAADRPQTAVDVLHVLDAQLTPAAALAGPPAARAASRVWLVAATLAVIGALAITGVLLMRQPPVISDAAFIAVVPFTPASPDTALTRLGRDLVVTMSANLEGVGAIRTADPLMTLSLWTERPKVSAVKAAGDIARTLGAKSFVQGTLIRDGPKVRLDFALHAVDGGAEPMARGSVVATADSISALTDSATWSLLRQIWRREQPPTPSVAAITTRSMTALRAYLEGELARADGRYPDAVAAFDRAIAADSSFWLAYWRNHSTRQWQFMDSDSVLLRYRAHLNELPERDRAVLTIPTGRGVTRGVDTARRIAERFPDNWEAWLNVGDRAFHQGPLVGIPLEDARRSLERVTTLNPRWVEALTHLLHVILVRDGIASANWDSVAAKLDRIGYDSASLQTYGARDLALLRLTRRIIADSASLRTPAADSVVRELAQNRMNPTVAPFFLTLPLYAAGGASAQIGLSRRVLAAGATNRDRLIHQAAIEWAWASRGAYDSALVLADTRARNEADPASALDVLRIAALAQWTGAVPDAFDVRRSGFADQLHAGSPNVRAEIRWLDGVLAAARKDSAGLEAALSGLASLALDPTAKAASDLTRSLRAFQLDLRGQRRAATDSLATLEWEVAERGTTYFSLAISRLTAARWMQSLGRNAEASRLSIWPDAAHVERSFFAARHMIRGFAMLERGRIAEAMGDVDEARHAYSEFLQRFDRPMAAHRHLLDEARGALTRLSRKGG